MSEAVDAQAKRRSRLGLPIGLQFSLAELAVILLYACFGAAALKSGGLMAYLFAQTTIVFSLAFVVAVVIVRGTARAFAIGFIVGAAGYGLPLVYFGSDEFDPDLARLPSSKLLGPLWSELDPIRYVASSTGQEIPNNEVRRVYIADPAGQMIYHQQWTKDGSNVETVERPPRTDFMMAVHAFCAAATGYVLGKLAAILYRRRSGDAARSIALAERNASP